MSSYQPGIPTGYVTLNLDYLNIQGNFQQLETTYGTDHVAYSQAVNNGYHTNIHLVPFSTTITNPLNNNYPISQSTSPPSEPTATGGFGQLFSAQSNDGINPDEMLYFLTGGNRLIQFTRNFVPTPLTNDYNGVGTPWSAGATFLPGGIIYQWGTYYPSAGEFSLPLTTTVKFPQAFTNTNTTILISFIAKSTGTNSTTVVSVVDGSITKTQFNWNITGLTAGYVGLSWTAIGT
jgi:hypothetical protein